MLSRNVLHGSTPRPRRLSRCCAAFECEDHLSNFDLLAFLNLDFLHHTADRGWNFHDSLIGLQLHDGLAFGDLGARCDHQTHEITLGNVLAEFR